MPKDPDEIGALWVKSGARGDYFTGTITSVEGGPIPIVVFKNDHKPEGSKQPDYRILKAKPKPPQPPDEFP